MAYIEIPGSASIAYGGEYLVEDFTTIANNQDTVDGAILASGYPFTLTLRVPTGTANSIGFDLTYIQVPCGVVRDHHNSS